MGSNDDDSDWGNLYGDDDDDDDVDEVEDKPTVETEEATDEVCDVQQRLSRIQLLDDSAHDGSGFLFVEHSDTAASNANIVDTSGVINKSSAKLKRVQKDVGKKESYVKEKNRTTSCVQKDVSKKKVDVKENKRNTAVVNSRTSGKKNVSAKGGGNISNPKSEIPEFGDDGLPVNWTGLLSGSAPFHLMKLRPGQEEYDEISEEFKGTGVKVKKIERIENVRLLDRFKTEMTDMAKHREDGFSLNTRYLYHGTSVNKEIICEEGLDQRLSCMGFFGKGIYFSDNPKKSIQYTEDTTMRRQTESYILRCRVLLGVSKVYPVGKSERTLKKEPQKEVVNDAWKYYDSVIGRPKDFSEFVVYDNRRAMIEYVITVEPVKRMNQTTNRAPLSTGHSRGGLEQAAARGYYIDGEAGYYVDGEASTEIETYFGDDFDMSRELAEQDDLESNELQSGAREIYQTDNSNYGNRRDSSNYGNRLVGSATVTERPSHNTAVSSDFRSLGTWQTFDDEVSEELKEETGGRDMVDIDQGNVSSLEDGQDDNDELKLNFCMSDFMTITNVDSMEMARDYVIRANLDVNRAVGMYYEELP